MCPHILDPPLVSSLSHNVLTWYVNASQNQIISVSFRPVYVKWKGSDLIIQLSKVVFAFCQFEHIYRARVCRPCPSENINFVSELPPHPRGAALVRLPLLPLPAVHLRARGPRVCWFRRSLGKCLFSWRDWPHPVRKSDHALSYLVKPRYSTALF